MGLYTSNARLGWIDDNTVVNQELLDKYDGFVIKAGEGRATDPQNLNPNSANQLNEVYKAKKPAIAFYTIDYSYMYGASFNSDSWPGPDEDLTMKNLDKVFLIGGVPGNGVRKYSAVILDFSKVYLHEGNTVRLSDNWLTKFGFQHLVDMIWKRYRIPVFKYFTPKAFTAYPANERVNLDTYMAAAPEYDAFSVNVQVPVDALGYPVESYSPIKDSAGNLRMGTGYWYFWLYSAVGGIKFLFNGGKDKLYNEIGFVVNPDPEPEPDPEPDPEDPPVVDNTEIVELLIQIRDELTRLSVHLGA